MNPYLPSSRSMMAAVVVGAAMAAGAIAFLAWVNGSCCCTFCTSPAMSLTGLP